MTKATVSRRIAELEQRLGARLLYRSTRQLPDGKPVNNIIYAAARRWRSWPRPS